MSLESAAFIANLVASNPTGLDPVNQGDDHIRLIKTALKATLPNLNGAANMTPAELNFLVGVTSLIQTQLDAKLSNAASAVLTANLNALAVTTAKINDLAVTTAKLNDLAVATGKIADNAVTLDKVVDIATASILGRTTAGTGDPEVLTVTQLLAMLPIKEKIINIGDWNMDTTETLNVTHGLTLANIRSVDVFINDDASGAIYSFTNPTYSSLSGSITAFPTVVSLGRRNNSFFDSPSFDSTSFNRGWVTLRYV